MPIQQCTRDGKLGWRWGEQGKCYIGPGAKRKAYLQGYVIEKSGYVENARRRADQLKYDPSRTATLRRSFAQAFERRIRRVGRRAKELVRQPGLFDVEVPTARLRAFGQWLKQQMAQEIAGPWMQRQHDYYWEQFIEQAYRRGVGRVFDELKKPIRARATNERLQAAYAGRKQEFVDRLARVGRENKLASFDGGLEQQQLVAHSYATASHWIDVITAQVFTLLEDITAAMASALTYELTSGISAGLSPAEIATNIEAALGISAGRARRIAQTETMRAYCQGELDAIEDAGVEATVQVEWSTAGDNVVCSQCAPMEGHTYTTADARGLLPAHPNAIFEGSTFAPYGHALELVRAWYDGPAVVLSAGDYRTTIGPNHPMTARRGMVPAAQLREGDEILYDLWHDNLWTLGGPNSDLPKEVPLVEDVFETSLSILPDSLVSSAGSNLHGDRVFCGGEVQAITPARGLLVVLNLDGVEQPRELESVSGFSSGHFREKGVFPPPSDGMDGSYPGILADDQRRFVWLLVHRVHLSRFRGWAFDGTTATGRYCNNGFVVKNCRCIFIPVIT